MQSPLKIRSSTSVNFHHAVSLLLFNQIIPTTCSNTPSSIPQQFFTYLFLRTTIPAIYTKNIFSTPGHSANSGCIKEGTKEIWNLVRNDTVLISPFFLKVWTMISGFTITDSLSFRLHWCIAGSRLWWKCLQ